MSSRNEDRYSRRSDRVSRYEGRGGSAKDGQEERSKGRYVRDYHSDRERKRDRSRSRGHHRDTSRERGRRDRSRRGSVRARSRESAHASSSRRRGESGTSRLTRFETVDYHALLHPSMTPSLLPPPSPYPTPPGHDDMRARYPSSGGGFKDYNGHDSVLQPTVPPVQDVAPSIASPAPTPALTPEQILRLLQQQTQPPPTTRSVAAVEDFIPVVPKSLLGLVGTATESVLPHAIAHHPEQALVALEAPKIAPEVERQTREARRAHLSGFPRGTTQMELLRYVQLLLPDVRRVMTQREIDQLARAAGESEESIRQIPPDVHTDVDEVRELTVNLAKTKPFAFLELSLPDLVTELIAQCQSDPQRFVFTAADGVNYPLLIRRPRDYVCMPHVDPSKLALVGFPPTLPEDKLRATFENFGALTFFAARGGIAYAEFVNESDAIECRTELHGEVLGRRVVLVLPMYDWMKVICVEAGIDLVLADDDPVSGKSVLHKLQNSRPTAHDDAAQDENAMDGALVVRGEGARTVDHMRALLEMSTPLPDVIGHLAHTYPHLRSLFRNAHVPIYPTRVLVLLNLFDEEELVLDESYSRLLAEIEAEVEQHGRVVELIVPRREAKPRAPQAPSRTDDDNPEEDAQAMADYEAAKVAFQAELERYMERQIHPVYGGYGRVFVVYATAEEASEAQRQIAGRMFGGRTVVTSFLFEDLLSLEQEKDTTPNAASDAAQDEDGTHAQEEDGTHAQEDAPTPSPDEHVLDQVD